MCKDPAKVLQEKVEEEGGQDKECEWERVDLKDCFLQNILMDIYHVIIIDYLMHLHNCVK